jgi:hypothetical protein
VKDRKQNAEPTPLTWYVSVVFVRSLSRRTCLCALTEKLILVLTRRGTPGPSLDILNLVILPVAYVHQQDGKSYRRSSSSVVVSQSVRQSL